MSITYHIGDTREVVATIPDRSVSLVACSPPFIALRSYLPADHPMKHAEIGSEPDPATFLDTLLTLTAEWGRVLAPWGSIAIELGDTFAGASAEGSDQKGSSRYPNGRGMDGLKDLASKSGTNWPRPKCLALVPQLYAASLAYGRNILTGAESPAGQWLVRNMIVWHRPNPAVGALGDKFRPSTSYITVATRSPKRWFDLTAVRGELKHPDGRQAPAAVKPSAHRDGTRFAQLGAYDASQSAGAPPLDAWFDQHDTWTVTTQPSSLAHYAMWPPKLAERLILSMCPAEVCAVCGEPRRRVEGARDWPTRHTDPLINDGGRGGGAHGNRCAADTTLGWTDCGHGAFIPGTVLDPFAGTGTTLAVADCHGRDAIGIDIDERNRDMVDARMAEVRRALFGVKPEMPGQVALAL